MHTKSKTSQLYVSIYLYIYIYIYVKNGVQRYIYRWHGAHIHYVPIWQDVTMKPSTTMKCNKCYLDFEGCEDKEAVCGRCKNKRARLSKMFGRWPTPAFKKLSDELQLDFWRSDSTAGSDMVVDLVNKVTEQRVMLEKDIQKGEYLPLSVYAAKGFDVKQIEATCSDTEVHPCLGLTYRVDLHQVSHGEVRNTVENEITQLLENKGKRGRSAGSDNETKNKKKKKSKKSSSSSSSSSSKSSASPSEPKELTKEQVIAFDSKCSGCTYRFHACSLELVEHSFHQLPGRHL